MNNKKKIIVFTLIIALFISIVLAFGFYYFHKKSINRENFCESNFTFSEDKIKWAQEKGKLHLLNEYFYCQAGLKKDYQVCDFYPPEYKGKIVEGESAICYKIVRLRTVFLALLQEKKVTPQIILNFNTYLDRYALPSSFHKKLFSSGGIEISKFLDAFLQKDVSICDYGAFEGREEDCQSFIAGDEKYCQNLADEEKKERCVKGAMLIRAIDSQDIGQCEKIEDEDNILPMVCRFVLNQDENLCTRGYLGSFVREYCSSDELPKQ